MNTATAIARLMDAMICFDGGDPRRIQHFIKVHDLSRTIGLLEGLDPDTLFILEAAAMVHDIAIVPCEAERGYCNGKLQEELGPGYARPLLEKLGFAPEVIDRVCWLVAHHHTYTDISGIDYQILVEADFLVNLFEDDASKESTEQAMRHIFRTETGIRFCREMFGL